MRLGDYKEALQPAVLLPGAAGNWYGLVNVMSMSSEGLDEPGQSRKYQDKKVQISFAVVIRPAAP